METRFKKTYGKWSLRHLCARSQYCQELLDRQKSDVQDTVLLWNTTQ